MTPQSNTTEEPRSSESVLSKVWGILTRRKANERSRIIKELRDAAEEVLRKKGLSGYSGEHSIVNKAAYGAYGTRDYILRNLIQHLPNHGAYEITEACLEASIAECPEDRLLTEDHINVSTSLTHAYVDSSDYDHEFFHPGEDTSPSDEYRNIMKYAMQNIEDGPLILHALYERGIGTLDGILGILPELRAAGHSALTEGAL